ncbi:hypothetical protein ENSA5_48640 [Enhygromyxa salina]|uniref:Uncharacterized protein n=1 Tax=Enhygromyxa salina TaxID=215803 RepID=A0A2S9XHU8_9BACT|nr:hypothetical protein [Enhygromyxa salina]PRP92446.1 hypothetical protein ENSA5_48640 [Enhygromyxa salina]
MSKPVALLYVPLWALRANEASAMVGLGGGHSRRLGWWCVVTLVLVRVFLRLPRIARWHQEQRRAALEREAIGARQQLIAQLSPSQVRELTQLERLVDYVRQRQLTRDQQTDSELVCRLDQLLWEFSQRARRLQVARSALALTQGDTVESVEVDDPVCPELAQWRAMARALCVRRIEELETELARISQVVRLVYEQTLACHLLGEPVDAALDDVVEEARLALVVRGEVEATVACPA